MQESGHYNHIFVGNILKNKGMYHLTEKHDIKIKFPKWYSISAHSIFTYIMNIAVLISSLLLAFDDPFEERHTMK